MHFVGSSYIVYQKKLKKKKNGSLRTNGWEDMDWTRLAEDGKSDGLA